MKTNKKGEFKKVGIPHAMYKATISKNGYQTKVEDWNFSKPQQRMQKVEVNTVVLVSEEQMAVMKQSKKLQGLIEEAREKIRQNDCDSAMPLLKKMLEEKKDDSNALYLMGVCYLKKRMLAEASASFLEVTKLNPKFPGGHLQLGITYQQQKEYDRALVAYKSLLELDAKNMVALYNSGLILYSLNRHAEALDFFVKALEVKPDAPEILEMTGLCYLQKADYAKAREYLEKAKNTTKNETKIKELEELVKNLAEMEKAQK